MNEKINNSNEIIHDLEDELLDEYEFIDDIDESDFEIDYTDDEEEF